MPEITLDDYVLNFNLSKQVGIQGSLLGELEREKRETAEEELEVNNVKIKKYTNEFWTAKQRQSNSLHEISYRACFKPELPRFFIELLTKPGEIVYDPFSGRGTTAIEAALLGRNVIANDVNPLSKIISFPRLFIPDIKDVEGRLNLIKTDYKAKADTDLSMFFDKKTESEIVSLRNYLIKKKKIDEEDKIDQWIRMVATNRLTGHSKGFFSVYTLPPNQATSRESQIKINKKRGQIPEYRDIKKIIIKKTHDLLRNVSGDIKESLKKIGRESKFLIRDSRLTKEIKNNSVSLVVTSPPFLDVVQYSNDNWLRCWFNNLDSEEIGKKISMVKRLEDWNTLMGEVLVELYRILKPEGHVAFEVGEVRNGKIRLDEHIVPLGLRSGFNCEGIIINQQIFTKTANIWGIDNNARGTNTNRIVVFKK